MWSSTGNWPGGRPANRSWEPNANLFSSPPLLDVGRHFDLGRASPWSSSELNRARRTAGHALLGARARPLLLPAVDLGLRLDGGGRRSARRYGRWRTESGASSIRPQGHRAGGGLERHHCGLLPSSSPRPVVPTRPSFLSFFFLLGFDLGSYRCAQAKFMYPNLVISIKRMSWSVFGSILHLRSSLSLVIMFLVLFWIPVLILCCRILDPDPCFFPSSFACESSVVCLFSFE
jgi:hypothetical protein